MPPEYDIVVTTIETLLTENLTLSFVKNRLLNEETKRKSSNKSSKGETSLQTAFASRLSSILTRKKTIVRKGEQVYF